MPDFKLSAQLKGHDGDVRAVSFPTANVVLSASRDHTVRIWRRTGDKPTKFDATITTQGHGYINSLTFLRPSPARPEYPDGLILSSGAEPLIEVKNPTSTPTDNAVRLLVGHSNNVCALDASLKGNWFVSGSWDGKAIVWRTDTWEISQFLVHEGDVKSVWAVLAYDENTVITGSADGQIRIFRLQGSKDIEVAPWRTISTAGVVRALCKLPTGLKGHPSGAEFASAGNDSVIRLWKMTGQEVGTLAGHESFIYSLACLPTGEIVSAGEDRTLRVWRGSQCVQTITHPAISVWSVAVCSENGDIVSGTSDNMIRVFTRNAERTADPETLSQFDQSVASSAIPQEQVGPAVNKEKLDPKSWLATNQGTKDGQNKLIREDDGSIGVYAWSSGQHEWIHVGTMVGSAGSAGSTGRKVSYNGKEYDFVFDVAIEDGVPALKLPYNLSDNPYEAATKFLGDNELPITYLDSVANFITQNTAGATIGEASGGAPADPYGNESRYRPGEESQPAKHKYLPHMQYLALTQAKLEAALKKLKELNAKHIEAGNKHIAMNPNNISQLETLVGSLSGVGAELTASSLEAAQIIFTVVAQWPYGDRLPALDILRCLVTMPEAATLSDNRFGNLISIALRGALDTRDPIQNDTARLLDFLDTRVDNQKVNANCVMMALRMITNLFSTPGGGKLVAAEADIIISMLARIVRTDDGLQPIGAQNINLQIALTSAAFNFACLAYRERRKSPRDESVDLGAVAQLINVVEFVVRKQTDGEVLFRALMALGMILAAGGELKELAQSLEVSEWVKVAAKKTNDARVKDVAEECLAYLK
ncbi:PUL domain-containing protein [Apodospora peruviana]|uniref:PUL domain-containing protein n=1 Tax=Apodospora peruviana TaxID=516989 RepID=A0AAE0IT27_9PEZI|nr:PUL domain-containing protein [Apodospora peruviana]